VGNTIINNYIGGEGVIKNTVGGDDDPDKKGKPDRSNSWIVIIISVAASLAAIITFFVKKQYLPDPPSAKDTIVVKQPPPVESLKKKEPVRSPKKAVNVVAITAVSHKSLDQSKLAVSIQDDSHNFDGAASQQVCDVFNSKNYKSIIAAAPLRDKKFARVAEGLLSVSNATDVPGANGSHTLNYTVNLTLTFYELPEETSCSTLTLAALIQTRANLPENKEDIKQQGLDKILKALRDKHSIPACGD